MINSYRQITGRYLKSNKKRTVLTIIGIILSVALISSIGLFFVGIQNAEIATVKSNDGSFHLAYKDIDKDTVSKIVNNPKVSRSGLIKNATIIKVTDKLSVKIITATDKALELLPHYTVKTGRLPQTPKEVAVESWMLSYIDKTAKLGSTIKLNNSEYSLVGILEDTMGSQVSDTGVVLTNDNSLVADSETTLLVEISSKTNLGNAVSELKALTNSANVAINDHLLTVEGASGDNTMSRSIYVVLTIVISVVLVVTIAVIYNSFQISVVERLKQFGLLRAVGGTPKQIRRIVLGEATILAFIGIPLGLLCGIIAIYGISLVFSLLGGISASLIKVSISPLIMGISALVGILSVYVSALIPAFYAGRISPLEAISSISTIKKEKFKRKNSFLIQKIFGFEGALASKNIKRNKKRYRVTVFSILISVMLFITFKSFTDMSLKINGTSNDSASVNFSIRTSLKSNDDAQIDSNVIDSVNKLALVAKAYKVYKPVQFQGAMEKSAEVKAITDMGSIYKTIDYNGNKTLLNGVLEIYDTDTLELSKKYIKSGSIDIDKLNSENGVIVIDNNMFYDNKTSKFYIGGIANFNIGDKISVQENTKASFGSDDIKDAKVMATLKDSPFSSSMDGSAMLKVITTDTVAKKLFDKTSVNVSSLLIMLKDVKDEDAAKQQLNDIIKDNPSLTLVNHLDDDRNQKSTVLMVEFLLYGFVVVVSLIGSVNIVNTLTTNIILRRREFATLKSIGLTQKGLRKMIILEGLLYGIMGSIYGSILGCGLSYLLFKSMSGIREFTWDIPWDAIGIATGFALLIGYLSVLSPLARIKKDNLIDTIREE